MPFEENPPCPIWLDPYGSSSQLGLVRIIFILHKRNQGLRRLYHLSMLLWEGSVCCFPIPLQLYRTMLRGMKGTEKPSEILIEHLLCVRYRGAKIDRVSALLEFNLWKECWDQKGVALSFSAGPFINLDVMIGQFPVSWSLTFLICKMGE